MPLGRSHPSPQLLTCLSSLPPFFCFSLLASPPIYQGHPHFKTFDLADSSVRNSLSIDVFMTSSFIGSSLCSAVIFLEHASSLANQEKSSQTHTNILIYFSSKLPIIICNCFPFYVFVIVCSPTRLEHHKSKEFVFFIVDPKQCLAHGRY